MAKKKKPQKVSIASRFNKLYALVMVLVVGLVGTVAVTMSRAATGNFAIVIQARGTSGTERMELRIRDQVVQTWTVSKTFSAYSYTATSSVNDKDIKVAFINNGMLGAVDKDIIVDYIKVDNKKFETEANTTLSTGTWTGANCNTSYPLSQTLHCNGYFQYSIGNAGVIVLPTPPSAGSVPIVIQARGTSGTERMELRIRDQVVQTWTVSKTFSAYSYTATSSVNDKDIKVAFINNAMYNGIDMDLHVDYITVAGVKFETEVPTIYSTGSWTGSNCNPSNPSSQVLHCSGYFQYNIGNVGQVGGTTPVPIPPNTTPTPPVTTTPPPTTTTASCGTAPQKTITAPASSLNTTVAADAPGTCYFLKNNPRDGNGNIIPYTFHDVKPKDNMKFIGESKTGVVVNGNGYENAFHGNTKNVTISNFTLSGFNSTKDCNGNPQSLQEQAPIRGTVCIWNTETPSQLATGWLIENMVIRNNVASGIFAGHDFTIRNNTINNNGVTGIGGTRFYGGLYEGNDVYGNGANEQAGAAVNGGEIKVTYVNDLTTKKQLVIRNNKVHDGKRGIWCDINCNDVLIENNNVYSQSSTGIFYEISYNATIRGNTVTNCSTWEDWPSDWNSGSIGIGESGNVIVENNIINGGKSAVTLRQVARPDPRVKNYILKNVTVRNNTISNMTSIGVSQGTSGGGIAQYGTLVFSGNNYTNNTSSMRFYWQGVAQTYSQWQAAGRK